MQLLTLTDIDSGDPIVIPAKQVKMVRRRTGTPPHTVVTVGYGIIADVAESVDQVTAMLAGEGDGPPAPAPEGSHGVHLVPRCPSGQGNKDVRYCGLPSGRCTDLSCQFTGGPIEPA